ncbi:hypothetical protein FQN50_009132 [Emmonsiellopsis sp. PD_5]|nr:hypothetical protein FQN50_009132 [Emmonsiellopsis sp. PD_5]
MTDNSENASRNWNDGQIKHAIGCDDELLDKIKTIFKDDIQNDARYSELSEYTGHKKAQTQIETVDQFIKNGKLNMLNIPQRWEEEATTDLLGKGEGIRRALRTLLAQRVYRQTNNYKKRGQHMNAKTNPYSLFNPPNTNPFNPKKPNLFNTKNIKLAPSSYSPPSPSPQYRSTLPVRSGTGTPPLPGPDAGDTIPSIGRPPGSRELPGYETLTSASMQEMDPCWVNRVILQTLNSSAEYEDDDLSLVAPEYLSSREEPSHNHPADRLTRDDHKAWLNELQFNPATQAIVALGLDKPLNVGPNLHTNWMTACKKLFFKAQSADPASMTQTINFEIRPKMMKRKHSDMNDDNGLPKIPKHKTASDLGSNSETKELPPAPPSQPAVNNDELANVGIETPNQDRAPAPGSDTEMSELPPAPSQPAVDEDLEILKDTTKPKPGSNTEIPNPPVSSTTSQPLIIEVSDDEDSSSKNNPTPKHNKMPKYKSTTMPHLPDDDWDDTLDDLDEAGKITRVLNTQTERCDQLDQTRFDVFTTFFMFKEKGIDPKDPRGTCKIPFMKRHPFHFQLYAVLWMLLTEHSMAGGGILGDKMGLGKTTELLTYFVLRHLIDRNWHSVLAARKPGSKTAHEHLPESTTCGSTQGQCPTQQQLPFLCMCACQGNSKTMRILRTLSKSNTAGAFLVVVPPSLLLNWVREYRDTVKGGLKSPFELLVYPPKGSNSGVIENAGDHPDINIFSAPLPKPEKEDIDTIMVLTSPLLLNGACELIKENVDGWSWDVIVRDEYHLEKGPGSTTTNIFRRLRSLNESGALVKPRTRRPRVWLLSGTPYEKGPKDVQHWMNILEERGWVESNILSNACAAQFSELCKVTTSTLRESMTGMDNQLELQHHADEFGEILRNLMIQRGSRYKWWGKNIINLPPHEHKEVFFKLNSWEAAYIQKREAGNIEYLKHKYAEAKQMWESAHRKGPEPMLKMDSFFKKSHQNRMLAVFPGALRLLEAQESRQVAKSINTEINEKADDDEDDVEADDDEDDAESDDNKNKMINFRFTVEELSNSGWKPRGNAATEAPRTPYSPYLGQLISSSGKTRFIKDLLRVLDSSCDHQGREEKLVLISPGPAVTSVLEEELERCNTPVAALYGSIKASDRDRLIQAFNEDTVPFNRGDGRTPRVIIGTPAILAQGVTLVRARHLVLMSPEWLRTDEDQAICRICRFGQKNDKTFSYRLICDDLKVEKGIVKRQKLRDDFNKMAMEVSQAVTMDMARRREARRRQQEEASAA